MDLSVNHLRLRRIPRLHPTPTFCLAVHATRLPPPGGDTNRAAFRKKIAFFSAIYVTGGRAAVCLCSYLTTVIRVTAAESLPHCLTRLAQRPRAGNAGFSQPPARPADFSFSSRENDKSWPTVSSFNRPPVHRARYVLRRRS